MKINFKEILYYAELAQLAYASDKTILAKFPHAIIKEIVDLKLKVFIIPDDRKKIYWVSCRGTANWEDAKLDIEYKKTPHNLMRVPLHEGFYKSAVAIYDKIIRCLPNNYYRIRLTGHSLGGAIAVILMCLLSETRSIDNCITFGQPKVGTRKFINKYREILKKLLRMVMDKDPVPLVPPLDIYSILNYGPYRHGGKEIHLLDEDSYEFWDEKKASGIFISSFWLHLTHEKISDHFMENYIKNIKEKLTL